MNEDLARKTGNPPVLLPMEGGVQVAVNQTIVSLTAFVLIEQGDWFEPELGWLRKYAKEGMRVLDIGANHGVFALSLAQCVGPNGRVWAVEPTPETFKLLEESRIANAFSNLSLFPLALSSQEGEKTFYLGQQTSELNSTTQFNGYAQAITVRTESLDYFAAAHEVCGVDIVKLDAEGEEINILDGGHRFFQENDPIVLCEVSVQERQHQPTVNKLSEFGFSSFRLVPGLGLLTPLNPQGEVDTMWFNIVACRERRIRALEEANLLSTSKLSISMPHFPPNLFGEYWQTTAYGPAFKSLLHSDNGSQSKEQQIYHQCLSATVSAMSSQQGASLRIGLLELAYIQLRDLCLHQPTLARQLTLIRIAVLWGDGKLVRRLTRELAEKALNDTLATVDEPFLSPAANFDVVPARDSPQNWIKASILHECAVSGELSFMFWRPSPPFVLLKKLEQLGFLLPCLRRRLETERFFSA